MTVNYTRSVSMSGFLGFFKLLFRWKGSVYKVLWAEFLVYIATYYVILVIGRKGLHGEEQSRFYSLIRYCRDHTRLVPLGFVLGFYTSQIFSRWWGTHQSLPRAQSAAVKIAACIQGGTERAVMVRRTLVRYLTIQSVLCLRTISPPVMDRFPTLKGIVDSGIMTEEELKSLVTVNPSGSDHTTPTLWFVSLLNKAFEEGLIRDETQFNILLEDATAFRAKCGRLKGYDWINIPLVYTQVVTLAIYTYFLACLFGRQYLPETDGAYKLSMYFPVFTLIEFIFYVGWLKVGQAMINPLGGDDDDFDVNNVIDKNIINGAAIVDRMHGRYPPIVKDRFWGQEKVQLPPYAKPVDQHDVQPLLARVKDFFAHSLPDKDCPCVTKTEDGPGNSHESGRSTHREKEDINETALRNRGLKDKPGPRTHAAVFSSDW